MAAVIELIVDSGHAQARVVEGSCERLDVSVVLRS